jgi:hypothetical protein
MALPTSRDEAMRLNSPKYFTGTACKHGHFAPRYTQSGTCQDCIRANVADTQKQRMLADGENKEVVEHLVAANIRVSAENYRRILELAFSLTRIRYPSVTLAHVERKKGGKDAQGGLLLYTLHIHPDDVQIVRSYANSLIPRAVDIQAARSRIFSSLTQQADAAAAGTEPEFRP